VKFRDSRTRFVKNKFADTPFEFEQLSASVGIVEDSHLFYTVVNIWEGEQ